MTKKTYNKRIEFSPIFNKRLTQVPLEIKIAFREALDLFLDNPDHTALRNHPLTENYAGIHSINVTDDWRALYRKTRERIIFVELGTHTQLYG